MRFSGVVPYAYDDAGVLRVLIGREAYGPEKGHWSCFAGGVERKGGSRETALQTACRECFEETMGLLGTPDTLLGMLSAARQVDVSRGTHYLLHIHFNGFLPHAFAGVRAMYAATCRDPRAYTPYREKDALMWICLPSAGLDCSRPDASTLSSLPLPSPSPLFRRGFLEDLPALRDAIAAATGPATQHRNAGSPAPASLAPASPAPASPIMTVV